MTSNLVPVPSAALQRLARNPRHQYLLNCGLADLKAGRHDRAYRVSETGNGAILKATIDDTNMFYAVGDVTERDFHWVLEAPGKGELHFETHQSGELARVGSSRLGTSAPVRYYQRLLVSAPPSSVAGVERLNGGDFDEIKQLAELFYPGTSFVRRVLSLPFFGIRRAGAIVALGGVIYLEPSLGACQVGGFLTHPEFRGQGLCTAILRHLEGCLYVF